MSIEKEVKISFHLTFGTLVQKSDDLISSATRDMNALKEFGITLEKLTTISDLKDEFINSPTDVEMGSAKVGKTEDKNMKVESTKSGIRSFVDTIFLLST